MSVAVHSADSEHVNRIHYSRLAINRVGYWLFLLSESMLFLGLLAGRF